MTQPPKAGWIGAAVTAPIQPNNDHHAAYQPLLPRLRQAYLDNRAL